LVKRRVRGHKAIRFWRRFSRPPSSTSGVECGIGPVWTLKYRSLVGAYAGFSAAHEALDVLSEIVTQEGLRNPR